MRQKNVPTSPVTAETSTRIAAKCERRTVIWAATGLISITTGVTSDTIGVTFATTAATFAPTGVTSGKTAATETKLTRVGRRRQGNLPPFFVEQRRPIALDLPKPAKRKLSQGEGR